MPRFLTKTSFTSSFECVNRSVPRIPNHFFHQLTEGNVSEKLAFTASDFFLNPALIDSIKIQMA